MLNSHLKNEQGFVLITSLMMLVVLMVIGIAATNTTNIELQISGNDKAQNMTFYAADSGNELSKELIEQAIEERGWQHETGSKSIGIITVKEKDFWVNDPLAADVTPDSSNNDVSLPFGSGQTYLRIGPDDVASRGGAIQMAAGYEGTGKGPAGGGARLDYDVRSRHEGPNNSESQIRGQWRHVL